MKRKIYIAADGGGTKLELGAVGADGGLLGRVRAEGGINRKTSDEASIEKTVTAALTALEAAVGPFEPLGIAGYLMHNDGIFARLAACPVKEVDEGTLGLYAAGIYGDGVLILSGTGADAYIIKDGGFHIVGGYGAILGDPGSGFAIGRAGINAAIAYAEGRGGPTSLLRLLREKYPSDSLRGSVYGIYASPQTARNVAAFCLQCETAADEGDEAARAIFTQAGHDLSSFALAGMRLYDMPADTPFTFAGGVLLHDLGRAEPLICGALFSDLRAAGVTNFSPPDGTPLDGAVRWIERNLIGKSLRA
ncbi:MAG: hypothetical protein J6330_10430 [Clostridia bacterium]|nr:hypothetical protein [Clostridia bacterium]